VAGDAITGSNMFAYCGNNPVMGRDLAGLATDFGAFATALLGSALVDVLKEKGVDADYVAKGLTTTQFIAAALHITLREKHGGGRHEISDGGTILYRSQGDYSYLIYTPSFNGISEYVFGYKNYYIVCSIDDYRDNSVFPDFVGYLNTWYKYHHTVRMAWATLVIIPLFDTIEEPGDEDDTDLTQSIFDEVYLSVENAKTKLGTLWVDMGKIMVVKKW